MNLTLQDIIDLHMALVARVMYLDTEIARMAKRALTPPESIHLAVMEREVKRMQDLQRRVMDQMKEVT